MRRKKKNDVIEEEEPGNNEEWTDIPADLCPIKFHSKLEEVSCPSMRSEVVREY